MPDTPVLAVRGEAHREVDPEIATIAATVSARSADRQRALQLLAERNNELRELVDTFGEVIERRETAGLWVYPDHSKKSSGERIKGYVGNATTNITVSDFTVLGDLVVALSNHEMTMVSCLGWGLRPDSPTYRDARHAALRDAVDRARQYAAALGVELVALIELADAGLSGRSEPIVPLAFAAESFGGGPELNLDPQRQRVYASVEARFKITEPAIGSL
jgi:uncharacterized protein